MTSYRFFKMAAIESDCSIAFKFGRVSSPHRQYAANVQGQRSKFMVTALKLKVTA